MTKPTSFSVTDVPCSCGYLKDGGAHPGFPLKYNDQFNEYYLEQFLPSGMRAEMIIYHCPVCGGVTSNSRRSTFFATVPDAEVSRLNSLISGISSGEDIERTLGEPDHDSTVRPSSFGLNPPQVDEQVGESTRIMTYTRLSKTAEVQFVVHSGGRIEKNINPKYTGNRI